MLKMKDQVKSRAKEVLFADKLVSPNMFKETLRLECFNMLSQFMEIEPNNLKMAILVSETGEFKIKIEATTNRIRPVGMIVK